MPSKRQSSWTQQRNEQMKLTSRTLRTIFMMQFSTLIILTVLKLKLRRFLVSFWKIRMWKQWSLTRTFRKSMNLKRLISRTQWLRSRKRRTRTRRRLPCQTRQSCKKTWNWLMKLMIWEVWRTNLREKESNRHRTKHLELKMILEWTNVS